ncbi:MAG: alpha/beta fold hydrolase [Phycisphaeraceae bacterium]|nr:alpha/beta fold hydrolase [Phycisphaeraceae bacterium]
MKPSTSTESAEAPTGAGQPDNQPTFRSWSGRLIDLPGLVVAWVALSLGRISPLCLNSRRLCARAISQGARRLTLRPKGNLPRLEVLRIEPPDVGQGPVILILHGWLECREMHLELAWWLRDRGASVWLADFPAHGRSGGRLCTLGGDETSAAVRVLDEIERTHGGERDIHLLGFSMGAATALRLAGCDDRPAGVVSLACFSNARHAIRTFSDYWIGTRNVAWMERGFERLLARRGVKLDELNPCEWMEQARCPVLLIHGESDRLTPIPDHYQPLLDRHAPGGIHSVLVPKVGHARLPRCMHPDMLKAIERFCFRDAAGLRNAGSDGRPLQDAVGGSA